MEIPTSPLDASLLSDFDFELLSNEMLVSGASLFQSPEYFEPLNHRSDGSTSISFFDSPLLSSASETTATHEDLQRESDPSLFDSGSFMRYPNKRNVYFDENQSVAGVFGHQNRVLSSKLLIRRVPTQNPSLNERLMHALKSIQENSSGDALVQIWVPTKKGGAHVLTTCGQPFVLNSHSRRLMNYRTVSLNYFFPADVKAGSKEVAGLPGRVFKGKLPEWTPDVQYYSSDEYARVAHARHYDVHGTLAVPVFERDNLSCLGVLEVVMTTQKIRFASEVENICAALQAVNLRSSEVSRESSWKAPPTQSDAVFNGEYRAAVPEILNVLEVVCETHKLPLALTWISCIQQGKMGSRHSDDNYMNCVSTLDGACYVRDSRFWGFQEACSEHHLVKGEGITGMAFTTNQPCFSPNVTTMSREKYPMLHHAKLFGLRAAIAIRLRSIYTGIVDYVLEFFLPTNCIDIEEQRLMLNSLFLTLQRVSQGLRAVADEEIECEATLQVVPPALAASNSYRVGGMNRISDEVLDENPFLESEMSRNDVTGEKHIGCPTYMPAQIQNRETQTSTSVSSLNNCLLRLDDHQKHGHVTEINNIDIEKSSIGDAAAVSDIKDNARRRLKSEKMITLEVLQQYFAGSLKDAAKSTGVCPTTLKRICRQYGIARWPSRKIKKVDHSLKKLQLVIDSVQGVSDTFKINSFYNNLPKEYDSRMTNNTTCGKQFYNNLPKECDSRMTNNTTCGKQSAENLVPGERSSIKPAGISELQVSPKFPSSCTQGSSSGHPCPDEETREAKNINSVVESGPIRSHGHTHPSKQPLMSFPSAVPKYTNTSERNNLITVKVSLGEEIIRFKIQPFLGFHDLREEIARRFLVTDVGAFELKYLDDDSEWVLLNCDDDLRECLDIYRSSNARLIKLSFHKKLTA